MWRAKMKRTRERDSRAVEAAQALGWTAVRIWEHAIREDVAGAASLVMAAGTVGRRST